MQAAGGSRRRTGTPQRPCPQKHRCSMSVSTLPYSLHVKQTTKHLSPPPFGILFPKTDNNANDIFKTLSESKQRKEVGLVMQLTIQYARLRVDHLIAAPTDKLHSAAERSQGHSALMAAINTLAEAMESAHEETLWRQTLGQDRKDIGDFACFIHCIPTSPQGDPTKHVARAVPGRSPTAGAAASISAIAMRRSDGSGNQPSIVLVKWYEIAKWLLERVESFPKNQRFVFGQRLADRGLRIMELLVEAAYIPRKVDLLARVNRELEVLRWLIRMAMDRRLFTPRQYEHCCMSLNECGRMHADDGQCYELPAPHASLVACISQSMRFIRWIPARSWPKVVSKLRMSLG